MNGLADPSLPAAHRDLPRYIAEHSDKSLVEILEPYRQYEASLRSIYAQDRQNPVLDDPHLNVVPLFTDDTKLITTRARDLASESEEEKSRYVMPLPDDKRRPDGSPATVANLEEFRKNFNIFSESSMVDMDWSNVVAAGSSVINCLLPVPKQFDTTKRKLREYYHEKFCPASDVDLFLYGLTHEQAIVKIKQIERAIKDALLNEVTVVRTKYALTIASQYPVRHIQVVLRVYKSVSEILTGFDIDAAGGAYDGKQVYVTPRALGSFITQINHVDLTRRSPSYENRLSKYSHRNFEVYWPELDRSRIDPTIFERSFRRTLGLARLLVLERLPTSSARETYLNKRRQERGRPTVYRGFHNLGGNIKDFHEDEVADWLSEEDVSNYHTFTVPYGLKFNAKRIEKLCYTRDLLLNAEWNQPKERSVYLHRHPSFFGRVEDVVEDCCGTCPKPANDEEKEVAEKEAEIYISGPIAFLIDDPGRQQIGSFNPLTEKDWTDMAYVGNTARLCQSIVDGDVDDVLNWLSQEGADPNQRDYTGRAPLHLAVMTSTADVVQALIDHGARLTARLADGRTALHLAAARGNTEMIKFLMEKSISNEEVEGEKQDRRRQANKTTGTQSQADVEKTKNLEDNEEDDDDSDDDSDVSIIDAETDTIAHSTTTASFVKITNKKPEDDDAAPEESNDDPDYFQIDVLSWDVPCSPLHLAIAEGHEDVVKLLCDYGADSILPVKFLNREDSEQTNAILTLTLALSLPPEKAKSMAQLLLKLGASSAQADIKGGTALYRYVKDGRADLVDTLLLNDKRGVKTAINHLLFDGYRWSPKAVTPLHAAIDNNSPILVLKLLNAGALTDIDYDLWLKSAKTWDAQNHRLGTMEQNQNIFRDSLEQPLIKALKMYDPTIAMHLLENGADPNSMSSISHLVILQENRRRHTRGETALDIVRNMITTFGKFNAKPTAGNPPKEVGNLDEAVNKFESGSYLHWAVSQDVAAVKHRYTTDLQLHKEQKEQIAKTKGVTEKNEAVKEALDEYREIEKFIVAKGGKTFKEYRPDITEGNTLYDAEKPIKKEETKSKLELFEFKLSFLNDKDITERRKEGYIELMEAAWVGDVDRIKALTLQAWGKEQDQPPLKIAIRDNKHNSPLSLSFYNRHYTAVKAILEIIEAQWSPADDHQRKYTIESDDVDDESYDSNEDEDEDESDSDGPRIVSEKVDKQFTIEDIGQVSMFVNSQEKPLDAIFGKYRQVLNKGEKFPSTGIHETTGLFEYVLKEEDVAALKILLDLAQHYSGKRVTDTASDDTDESSGNITFPADTFRWAVENGKSQMLGLIIKRTGAGMPLDHLIKKSGVEMKEKPRFYQGLTVYGKKRKDWATAGRNMVVRTTGIKISPLLHAALGGNIDSVELFLSDTPHRSYSEFSKSKAGREDPRLKHLMASAGGFDRVVSKWLGADNDLVIHCAVLAQPSPGAEELLRYLTETCPAALEKKSTNGDTPLLVACRMGRRKFIEILIEANADQSVKNLNGENIVHATLTKNPVAHQLRGVLDLFDKDLRTHLFSQRKNLAQDGTTPLHTWVYSVSRGNTPDFGVYEPHSRYQNNSSASAITNADSCKVVETLKVLLEYCNGEHLDALDGAGDTCLHTAIMYERPSLVKVLVDTQPSLLFRENAVGRTPAELAHDLFIGSRFKEPAQYYRSYWGEPKHKLLEQDFSAFADGGQSKYKTPKDITPVIQSLGLSGEYEAKEVLSLRGALGVANDVKETLSAGVVSYLMWDVCYTSMVNHPDKRRLVSLNEANDVAKRLGETFTKSRYFSIEARRDEDEDEDSETRVNDRTKHDFAVEQMKSRLLLAWKVSRTAAKEWGWSKCSECKDYHE